MLTKNSMKLVTDCLLTVYQFFYNYSINSCLLNIFVYWNNAKLYGDTQSNKSLTPTSGELLSNWGVKTKTRQKTKQKCRAIKARNSNGDEF